MGSTRKDHLAPNGLFRSFKNLACPLTIDFLDHFIIGRYIFWVCINKFFILLSILTFQVNLRTSYLFRGILYLNDTRNLKILSEIRRLLGV